MGGGEPCAHILVVDDEPDICWALERLLTRMGFAPFIAPNGTQALALARRMPFRMALVDAKLPDIEGIVLAHRLKQIRPGLPVVLVSGFFYDDDHVVLEAKRLGIIQAFVGKPFDLEQIREVVRTHGP